MAQGDPEGEEEAWGVDYEFEDGNSVAVTDCHCAGSSDGKREKGVKVSESELVNRFWVFESSSVGLIGTGLNEKYLWDLQVIYKDIFHRKGSVRA